MSSPIHAALAQRDLVRVKKLLSEGADPNAPDESGLRPLHVAITDEDPAGSLDLVTMLVRHGAIVNSWDDEHYATPLLRASDPPNFAVAKVLLEHGADANDRRGDGESPLRLSVQAQDFEMAKLLLHHGAAASINDWGGALGLTALAHAASNFDVPLIELLLQAGANPERLQEFGETARDKLPPREEHDPQEWDRVMELLGRRKI
jgi:ankyrin repeat protein